MVIHHSAKVRWNAGQRVWSGPGVSIYNKESFEIKQRNTLICLPGGGIAKRMTTYKKCSFLLLRYKLFVLVIVAIARGSKSILKPGHRSLYSTNYLLMCSTCPGDQVSWIQMALLLKSSLEMRAQSSYMMSPEKLLQQAHPSMEQRIQRWLSRSYILFDLSLPIVSAFCNRILKLYPSIGWGLQIRSSAVQLVSFVLDTGSIGTAREAGPWQVVWKGNYLTVIEVIRKIFWEPLEGKP